MNLVVLAFVNESVITAVNRFTQISFIKYLCHVQHCVYGVAALNLFNIIFLLANEYFIPKFILVATKPVSVTNNYALYFYSVALCVLFVKCNETSEAKNSLHSLIMLHSLNYLRLPNTCYNSTVQR